MPYRITITDDAERQYREFSAREQRILAAAIQSKLVNQPDLLTRSIKQLRPNPFAQYELRVGDLRILYNVEVDEVVILLVGRKSGNKLIVEGEEFHAHQDHPAEPPGNGTGEDAH